MAKRKPLVSQHLGNISRDGVGEVPEHYPAICPPPAGSVCTLSTWKNPLRRTGKQSPLASRPPLEGSTPGFMGLKMFSGVKYILVSLLKYMELLPKQKRDTALLSA